jgi:hypothetical protein
VDAAAGSESGALEGVGDPPSRRERVVGWLRAGLEDPVRVIGWFQVGVLGGMAALTAVFFTLVTTRMDQRVYGRYTEMVLPPVIAAGAAWLLTRPWTTVAKGAVAGLLVVGGATLAILGPQGMANFRGSGYSINQVVAIAWHGGDAEVPIPRATAYALVALVLVVLAARLKLVLAWLVVAALLFAGAVRPVERRIAGGQAFLNQRVDFPMDVDRAGDIDSFAFAIDQASRQDAAVLQHWLPGKVAVPWWDGQPPPAGEEWAVARIGSRRVTLAGGRMVFINSRLHHALYVLPGPQFDRLEAAGRLLPVRLREPLPEAARVGTVTRRAEGPVVVRSGETTDVPVEVAHRGTAHPWVDFGSYQGTGVVRLAYRWIDPATGRPEQEPKLLRADLTRTLWPGETDHVVVPVEAIDRRAGPRLPGTYEIEIYLLQEQLGAFPGAPLRVTVEVR